MKWEFANTVRAGSYMPNYIMNQLWVAYSIFFGVFNIYKFYRNYIKIVILVNKSYRDAYKENTWYRD